MRLVRTTLPDRDKADALAKRLVGDRLACCVHVHELSSRYLWKDKIEEATEWLVEARCIEARYAAVRSTMQEGHPYDVPLLESVLVDDVLPAYRSWAHDVTGRPRL